ncbi:MAG: hypothetical protein N3I35_08175 [Clostridia bacterium]|nr:hypothetical protein [Clostridia bacterium]
MQGNGNTNISKKLALTGIMTALAVIILFLATIMPTNRISLYALSSFFIAIVIIEFGVKTGWIFYFSSGILAFIIIQFKIRLIPYVIFFGIYGLIKYYIEKINNYFVEIILKILYFNISLAVSFYLVKEIFLEGLEIKFPWWIAVVILEVVFIVYDYVYTLFIQYYRQKLKKILKI